MKDLKLFLISILESIFIVLFLCCLFLVYLNYSTKNHTNYEISKELICRTDSSICEIVVLKAIEQIPTNHIKILKDNDYKIIISDEVLFEKYEKYKDELFLDIYDIGGMTIHKEKLVILKENFESIYFSIFHEIGHCIDNIYGRPSDSEEFLNCFNLEKNKIRKYAQKNSREYFADIYGLIYVDFPYFLYNIKMFPLSYAFFINNELF